MNQNPLRLRTHTMSLLSLVCQRLLTLLTAPAHSLGLDQLSLEALKLKTTSSKSETKMVCAGFVLSRSESENAALALVDSLWVKSTNSVLLLRMLLVFLSHLIARLTFIWLTPFIHQVLLPIFALPLLQTLLLPLPGLSLLMTEALTLWDTASSTLRKSAKERRKSTRRSLNAT